MVSQTSYCPKDGENPSQRPVETLRDKKILKNIRIYSREGPIIEEKPPGSFKRYLPQFLSNFAINLIMVNAGLALSYPSLVIGYLLPINETSVSNQDTSSFLHLSIFAEISFDKLQSSIYSSLQFLSIPVGCLLGGCIIDRLGRKKVMFAASIPMFISWLMNFMSQNITMLYFANIFSGIAIGLGEPAIATYQGEVSEPPIRGAVINFAILWMVVSLLGPYVLHIVVPSWRWIALIFSVMPIVAALVALIVPESPMWLLSKGQVTLAEKSLITLRGGVTKKEIDEEIQDIIAYHYSSTSSCNRLPPITSSNNGLLIRDVLKEKWDYFKSEKIRRPFILSCIMFSLVYSTGISTIRPYLNPVLNMLHFHGSWTFIGLTVTCCGVIGNMLGLLIIGITGKRILVLSALVLNGLCALIIAIAIFKDLSVCIKLISLHIMCFANGYGIIPAPWILQSELYPFRGRGFAAGLAAALSYFMGFISALVFLPLTNAITLQVMFIIFFCFSLFGAVYLYFKMPETEGRSLQQIEEFFSNKKTTTY